MIKAHVNVLSPMGQCLPLDGLFCDLQIRIVVVSTSLPVSFIFRLSAADRDLYLSNFLGGFGVSLGPIFIIFIHCISS